jgi:hypothetical protein
MRKIRIEKPSNISESALELIDKQLDLMDEYNIHFMESDNPIVILRNPSIADLSFELSGLRFFDKSDYAQIMGKVDSHIMAEWGDKDEFAIIIPIKDILKHSSGEQEEIDISTLSEISIDDDYEGEPLFDNELAFNHPALRDLKDKFKTIENSLTEYDSVSPK